MKNGFYVLGFITYSLFLSSCSSEPAPSTPEEKTTGEKTVTIDSSSGLTGVVDEHPPVNNGDFITKYPNGITKMKGYYINGKREGAWISFFENGEKQSEGFFKNGLRDGKALVYFDSGKLYYEGYYKDGKEVGKWVFFDQNGKKINEKDYGNPLP